MFAHGSAVNRIFLIKRKPEDIPGTELSW